MAVRSLGKSLQTSLGRERAGEACEGINICSSSTLTFEPVQAPAYEEVLLAKESRGSKFCQTFDHMVSLHLAG